MYQVCRHYEKFIIGRTCLEEDCTFDMCVSHNPHAYDDRLDICVYIKNNTSHLIELAEFLKNKCIYSHGDKSCLHYRITEKQGHQTCSG